MGENTGSDTGITYIRGDATSPHGKGRKLIAHVCNDLGGWGKGFVLAVSKRWPQPETEYRRWHKERATNGFGLGALQVVRVERYIWVANMIGQHGIRPGSKGPPIRYDALDTALAKLALEARDLGATVHMPRIGCGLAGGSWDRVEPLITQRLTDADITVCVYDYADPT
ncbi:Appr-1-p processing protein [Actinospica durhamensis]|uniref:Appr-1-p processing protein n=1 Tax=Actinospica durhamensis TaxID=1508375 RepID=A0A941EVF8_9ACTN|nr:macro domain-containing protein [Actinospica durhamensis]MBR7838006.1 Appr-1-p processing protein [Actinospica durhamensis]